MKLNEALKNICKLNLKSMEEAKVRLDSLTKPLGSLGTLEDIVQRLAGIFETSRPTIDKKAVVVMCSDNGVVDEGVSSCPKSVTASVTRNFLKGITGLNVLSNIAKADLFVVDVGVDDDLQDVGDGIIHKKIRNGTWNIAKGPAMTREEAITAIEVGINIVGDLKEKGYKVIATGEMGIGNTTTSSAIAAIFMDVSSDNVVGKGAGLTKEGYINKIDIVRRAIEVNKPDPHDPIDVLAKVGGFDIAAMVGCFIGAAVHRIPVIIDGFISSAAALIAVKLEPAIKDFIFPSHVSAEPGSEKLLNLIGFKPMLTLGMRLGEGTGAVLAFQVFDWAMTAYTQMGTFNDAAIEQYKPLE